jgi:hypothetical protein
MATSSPPQGFTFGIEIEIYLRPKKEKISGTLKTHNWTDKDELNGAQRATNRKAILMTIADIITAAGPTTVAELEELENEYLEWQVKFDSSLPHAGGFCQYHHVCMVTTHS